MRASLGVGGDGLVLWNSWKTPESVLFRPLCQKPFPVIRMDVDLQGTHRNISCTALLPVSGERRLGGWRQRSLTTSLQESGMEGVLGDRQKQIPENVSVGLWRDNTSSFPLSPDLTSLLTGGRPAGVHLPGLQPSASQFFASLDPINEASAILSPLSSNPRNSVQHQFQDTFPGTKTLPSARLTLRSTAHTSTGVSHARRGLAIPELMRERKRKISQEASSVFCSLGDGGAWGVKKVCGGPVG